jgi:hypothetical protein
LPLIDELLVKLKTSEYVENEQVETLLNSLPNGLKIKYDEEIKTQFNLFEYELLIEVIERLKAELNSAVNE